MQKSFTGTSKKARQVNLSGRNPNAWASFSSPKSSSTPSGTQSTLAHVQAERVKRQHDRDILNASKTIQKAWRKHSSREKTRKSLRAEWDNAEERRLVDSGFMADNAFPWVNVDAETLPYSTAGECFSQLSLLTTFLNVKVEMDRMRLLFFGRNLRQTLVELPSLATGDMWTLELSRLGRLTLKDIIEQDTSTITENSLGMQSLEGSLDLLKLLALLIPKTISTFANNYYSVLAELLQRVGDGLPGSTKDRVLAAALALIQPINANTLLAYSAFAVHFLTIPDIDSYLGLLDNIAANLNYKLLSKALAQLLEDYPLLPPALGKNDDAVLWLLAHFIYLHRHGFGPSLSGIARHPDAIRVIAVLLGTVAESIIQRMDPMDDVLKPYEDHSAKSNTPTPLPAFVREQIGALKQQSNVSGVLMVIGKSYAGRANEESSNMAKSLAMYALTLLRIFPDKAYEIRMWLYRGSSELKTATGASGIDFFWSISRNSRIFLEILRSHKAALHLIKGPIDKRDKIGKAAPSKHELDSWRQEWNIIFLFFEMYTFVLKFLDDEEFLSAGRISKNGPLIGDKTSTRDGVLPLQEVADMSLFLKNLAFTLYWHSSELRNATGQNSEGIHKLGSYFGATPPDFSSEVGGKRRSTRLADSQTLSIDYLKDLTTRVLRLLHERDSRRHVFSKDHWLMTSQIDMAGFIPAVVAEEEKRNEIQEGEDDSGPDDIDDNFNNDDPLNASTGWSRPNLFHQSGRHTYDPRQSKYFESLKRKQEQTKRERQLEMLAPRIELLRNLPFFIPFETRVQIFREFVHRDQMGRRNGFIDPDLWRLSIAQSSQGRSSPGAALAALAAAQDRINRHHAKIRRESVFDDAFDQFYGLGEELKEPIQISFIDKFDTLEAGIDGGGVTKEFLTSVTTEAFDPSTPHPMFVENDQRYLYPNPNRYEEVALSLRKSGVRDGSEEFHTKTRRLLQRYEFLGRVIGKCLYEGILVDINFAGFFLQKWALTGGTTSASNETAYRANINDIRDLDEELYQGLLKLKNYDGDVESDFSLNFTVSDSIKYEDAKGEQHTTTLTRGLKPNGANEPVTNANRLAYLSLVALYRLQRQPQLVTNHFLKGLGQIIPPMWLAMFNQGELQTLVGGDTKEVDIADLRRNTQYSGAYFIGDDGQEHPTIKMFWQVLKDLDDKDRRKVLKFVTSTPRAPLLGFSHLNPRFSIRDSGGDQVRLPSTSTCVNLLKLPRYTDAKMLKEKLLYAVNAGAGFDLS